MLSWFGTIGVGTSLYVAGQYFEYWLRTNDPADHPLVEEFIAHPMKMVTQTPGVMATKPVLSVVLSGLLLARLSLGLFVNAIWQYFCLARAPGTPSKRESTDHSS
jgi:hypothetical protein